MLQTFLIKDSIEPPLIIPNSHTWILSLSLQRAARGGLMDRELKKYWMLDSSKEFASEVAKLFGKLVAEQQLTEPLLICLHTHTHTQLIHTNSSAN